MGEPGNGKRDKQTLRLAAGVVLVALIATSCTGCGTSVATNLPDISQKNAVPEGGRKPLNAAEQKQAIDAMIAKRDAQNKDQNQPK